VSYRDLVMMTGRGIRLAHTAISETYINVKGAWAYVNAEAATSGLPLSGYDCEHDAVSL
jgi:hypothetical protein